MDDRSYYCSLKFRYVKIDLENLTISSCHAAKSHPIDLEWIKSFPNQIFNDSITVNERKEMLENIRNQSCENNCWPLEDKGMVSPRLSQKGEIKTITSLNVNPEIIDIVIGSDCNLTCVYCCPEYSSSWKKDVIKNGRYSSLERYSVSNRSKALLSLSQKDKTKISQYNVILESIIQSSTNLKTLYITGGEPLLNNYLFRIIDKVDANTEIFTGLGVPMLRFRQCISKVASRSNVTLVISCESTGSVYEFNRYGNSWPDFLEKVELIKKHNIQFIFQSVLSNMNVFDFVKFFGMFAEYKIRFLLANTPDFLAINVMDDESKAMIVDRIRSLPTNVASAISSSIIARPTEKQRIELREFLIRFIENKNIVSPVFPLSFLKWLDIDVVQ